MDDQINEQVAGRVELADGRAVLWRGDCMAVLRGLPDGSADAIVTDPPAGIAFMGNDWDRDKGGRDKWIAWMAEVARECRRVIKPGGHALVWALPRTSHWTATAWEDAGWEVRDRICHAFAQGFPKGHDISKALDALAGAEREVIGVTRGGVKPNGGYGADGERFMPEEEKWHEVTAPATDLAKRYAGFNTALKPAIEDWWLFRAPLAERTVAQNVATHGTGALNIGACRVPTAAWDAAAMERVNSPGSGRLAGRDPIQDSRGAKGSDAAARPLDTAQGRWPANLVLDDSPAVRACFPETKTGDIRGDLYKDGHRTQPYSGGYKGFEFAGYRGDAGSAARFFTCCPDDDTEDAAARRILYCGKATRRDRDDGCEALPEKECPKMDGGDFVNPMMGSDSKRTLLRNTHATVKPVALMRHLVRLITPPNGTVLDPFMGSGSTGKAALLEGFRFVGIEQDAEYVEISKARIEHAAGVADAAREQAVQDEDKQQELFR